jgi:hypothetical protein
MESHTGNPKNIGGLNNTLGSLVERVMTPDLPLKFKPLGFTFDKITTVKWSTDGNIYAEIDGLLENGTQAMAVEVKTTIIYLIFVWNISTLRFTIGHGIWRAYTLRCNP